MTNDTLKRILMGKGISHLYHVNSVATASTFLENGGLLSRGVVEDRGLFQTPQETDELDKEVDVFYDIFFDSVDIHHHIKSLNHYGPVLFVYSVNLLDALPEGQLKITKDNPIRWNSHMTDEEKYFSSESELRSCFERGKFAQHITIRHQKSPLSFDYLEKIILDDPGVDDTSHFQSAYDHLQDLIKTHGIHVPLEVRQCPAGCTCLEQYGSHKIGYVYYRFRYQ